MIKIENTKIHRANDFPFGAQKDKLVTDAKLVLVDDSNKEYISNLQLGTGRKVGDYCKPILISETEKIDRNDKLVFNYLNNSIEENTGQKYCYKIIALPEHFSQEQLQMIVDGKLKDGNKVLVECEEINEGTGMVYDSYKKSSFNIILNPHITIYPVEEKKYTWEQVFQVVDTYFLNNENVTQEQREEFVDDIMDGLDKIS